jgi:hypothetical protein
MDSNCCGDFLWQSNGKVKKFSGPLLRLQVLRELVVLCSLGFDSGRSYFGFNRKRRVS